MLSGIHQVARAAGVPLIVIQQALGDQQLSTFGADQISGWIVLHPHRAGTSVAPLNLLANAVKFTEQGGISVCAAPTDGAMVCISVMDSGIGIAPAHQALVFEEFRQVQDAQHAQQGTGLGCRSASGWSSCTVAGCGWRAR
jgi:hypothetical protein